MRGAWPAIPPRQHELRAAAQRSRARRARLPRDPLEGGPASSPAGSQGPFDCSTSDAIRTQFRSWMTDIVRRPARAPAPARGDDAGPARLNASSALGTKRRALVSVDGSSGDGRRRRRCLIGAVQRWTKQRGLPIGPWRVIWPAEGLLAQRRLDEAFRVVIGLRSIGTRGAMHELRFRAGARQVPGTEGAAVVGQQRADGHAEAGRPPWHRARTA